MRNYSFILILIALFSSCTTLDVFEKTKTFSTHEWSAKETPTFTFEIKDTNSAYNIYYVLRHEDAYHYKNIWVNINMKAPDTTISFRREFILADNTKWLGTAMSDIIEHRATFNPVATKLKKGTYTFTLQQDMREEPLEYILATGIRVEKAK